MDEINKNKFKSSLVKFCIYLIFIIIISYISQIDFILYYKEYFSTIFTLIGGRYLCADLFKNPINSLQKSIEPFIPAFFNMSPFYEMNMCEKFMKDSLFNCNDLFINSIHEQLVLLFSYMKTEKENYYMSLNDNDEWESNNNKRFYNCFLKKFKVLRNMILHHKNNIIKTDNDILKSINNDLEELLSTYDDDIKSKTNDIIGSFLNNILNTKKQLKLDSLFLYGSPGVGKTRLINKIVDILNKNMKINLYKPTKKELYDVDGCCDENLENFNIVLKAYIDIKKGNCDGCIIFIDEFDKLLYDRQFIDNELINFLASKLLLDQNYCEDYQFKIKIPLNKILIVIAGNELPWKINVLCKCLESRFNLFNFPNLTKENKINGLIQFYDENWKNKIVLNKKELFKCVVNIVDENRQYNGLRELSSLLSIKLASRVKDEFFGNSLFKVQKKNFL